MDRRERANDLEISLLAALDGKQSEIHTALPGIIQSFNPVEKTCTVQPAIQFAITSQVDGSKTWVDLPLLLDCPIYFPSGGGYTLTFPIAAGDECLIILAERCIDAWWKSGGHSNPQALFRMHDLSDGFVFSGVSSVPHVQPAISTVAVQLRTTAGTTYLELNGTAINIVSPSTVHVTAPTVTVDTTTATINATGTATITSPSIILKNAGLALKKLVNDTFIGLFNSHVHSGVTTGSGNTGVPTSSAGSGNTTSTVQAE